jgi:hypothetical protein
MGEGVNIIGDNNVAVVGGLYDGNERGEIITEFDYNNDVHLSVYGGDYAVVAGGDYGGISTKVLSQTLYTSFGGNANADKVVGGNYGGLGGVVNTEIRVSGGIINETLAAGNALSKYVIGETKLILESGFDHSSSFALGRSTAGGLVTGITGNGMTGNAATGQLTRSLYYSDRMIENVLLALCEPGGFDVIKDFSGEYTEEVHEYNTVEQNPPVIVNEISDIAKISELNNIAGAINSHAGEKQSATLGGTQIAILEKNFRESVSVPASEVGTESAFYARVKKTLSGDYFMIYQDHMRLASGNIYYTLSDNLKDWSEPQILFEEKKVFGGASTRRYHTADAIVLQNGDILVAACYQASGTRGAAQDTKGLVVKRSNDGGYTWSEEQVVYYARNWEPAFLQLPSGEVQLYYTSSASYYALYPGETFPINNSGTSLLRSFDNGYTFSPLIASTPYEGYRIINIFGSELDGKPYYTGQMPVPILLNGSDEIAVSIEMIINNGTSEVTSNGIAFSSDNWAAPLDMFEAGPADYIPNINPAASAPYICQFPSGETVYSGGADLKLKIGDSSARVYQTTVYKPFSVTGYGGSLELIGSHTMLAVMGSSEYSNGDYTDNTVELAPMYLNHKVFAKNASITIDGNNSDWDGSTEAIFVGSDSQAQATLRYAYDASNIYIITERLDNNLTAQDTNDIYLTTKDSSVIGGAYRLTVDQSGIAAVAKYASGAYSSSSITGMTAAVRVNNTGDDDGGYVVEIKIPKSSLDFSSGILRTNLAVNNSDCGAVTRDILLTTEDEASASKWLRVEIGQ